MRYEQVRVAAFAGVGLVVGVGVGIPIGRGCNRAPAAPARLVATPAPPEPAPPPPVAVAPTPIPVSPPTPVARDLGTLPYKLQSVTLHRWDGEKWRVRANYQVTRLREAPEGTVLGSRMMCEVGTVKYVSAGLIGPPGGPIGVGETGPTFSDHFFHTPFEGMPERCELLLYVQMPGARPDQIDHEAGRACILPDGKTDRVTLERCPVVVEAPE